MIMNWHKLYLSGSVSLLAIGLGIVLIGSPNTNIYRNWPDTECQSQIEFEFRLPEWNEPPLEVELLLFHFGSNFFYRYWGETNGMHFTYHPTYRHAPTASVEIRFGLNCDDRARLTELWAVEFCKKYDICTRYTLHYD